MGSPLNITRDKIFYRGHECIIEQWPLQTNTTIVNAIRTKRKEMKCGYTTNNWSGFSCSWEIIDTMLYLTKVELSGCYKLIPSDDGRTTEMQTKTIALSKLFATTDKRVKAFWYNGILKIILRTERITVDEKSIATFKNEYVEISITNGEVSHTGEIQYERFTRRALKDYIQG